MGRKKDDVQATETKAAEGIEVTCQRCGNTWTYRGKSKFYVNCSVCKTSINLRKFMPAEPGAEQG